MAETTDTTQSKAEANSGGVTPNQLATYQKVAIHSDLILQKLFDLLESRNESVALGAAKILVNKILPDKKVVEVTGENGEPIKLNIISGADYLSATGKLIATSAASSSYGPAEVQGIDLAQTGQENNNSNQPASEVEST